MSSTILLASAASGGHSVWPALAAWLPAIAMIVGIITLGSLMMVFFHRRERQLKALAAQIAGDVEEARALRSQLEDVHTRASNMMVTAQRLAARLDERVAALDMASLRMNATRNALPRTPAPAHTRARPSEILAPESACAATSGSQPDRARAGGAAAATLPSRPTVDPLTQQGYDLADAGRAPLAIARDLNEQVGKVELILALRQR